MKPFALLIALAFLMGQDSPQEEVKPDPELFRVLAIHATAEGRATALFDPTLVPLQEYLSKLPYDTFREAYFDEASAPYGGDAAFPLNERYTLHCSPVSLNEAGEVLFEAHIDFQEGSAEIEALRVAGRAARGQGVVFRGLEMPEGELIIMLSVAQPGEKGGGSGGGQDSAGQDSGGQGDSGSTGDGQGQDSADSGEQTGEQEDEPQDDGQDRENRQARAARPSQERKPPPPTDRANLEGILKSLEEQDMREQQNARNRRYDVVIRGDWW